MMKAKFIVEHINFKRGVDPKDAMGLAKKTIRIYGAYCEVRHIRDFYHLSSIGIHRLLQVMASGDKSFDLFASYMVPLKDFWFGSLSDDSKYRIDDLVGCNVKYEDQIYFIPRYLNEAINFQRGLDPKEAMGTGMTDERILEIAEKILEKAFPKLYVKFKSDMNTKYSYYALINGKPTLLTDLQLIYNSKKSKYPAGFCLYNDDGGEIFVPEELFDIEPVIESMIEYVHIHGHWQNEKKHINPEYIK